MGKKVNRIKQHNIYRRDLSHFEEQSFLDDIRIQNWNNETNTNNKFNDFLWRLEGCLDRHVPVKKIE